MPLLFWDVETRSTVNLETAGAWRYAADPTTEVLCIAYAINDGDPQIWIPGDLAFPNPPPEPFIAAARDTSWQLIAHNVGFERPLAIRHLGPRYQWPQIPLAQWRCSMAAALASALPGSLDGVAAALGLPPKDAEGYKLMRRMGQPRRRRKGEDPNQIYWIDGPEPRRRLQRYCVHDVRVERAVYHRVPQLSDAEQLNWQLDQLINERGFQVDLRLARAAQAMARREQAALDAEVAAVTDGEILSVHQVAKIKAFVRERGHALASLTKRSISGVLAHDPDEQVRRLLELRKDGAKASVQKLERLLASVDDDGRLRGTLRFCGAATGRWSGRGFQPQNLKKVEATTDHLGDAIAAILAGDVERVRALGAPLTLAGETSRSVICAAPGRRLIGADFSAIESRVLAWISGESWKIETYREYDRTANAAFEPYCVGASKVLQRPVTPADEVGRGLGKIFDLSFGYGGGLGAWRRFDHSDTYSDPEVETFKRAWRREHQATCRFWRGLERAAHRAIHIALPVQFGSLSFAVEAATLFLTLPSGRRIAYPEARLVPGKFEDTREVLFKDNAKGAWVDRGAWYGTLVENVVQAISRDLLAAAMQRLEAAGYPVVLHVHDEIVCEVPEGFGSEAEFLRIMLELPEWAAGLPVAAKVWSGRRYAKSKTGNLPDPEPCNDAPTSPEPSAPPEAVESPGISEDGSDCTVPLAALIGKPLTNGAICCPFHDDAEPSLKVYDDHYHCFGCGAHGNQVDWLMQVDGLSRKRALKRLAEWDGPALASRQAREDDDALSLVNSLRIWDEASSLAGTPAAAYLARRGIDLEALPANIDEAVRFHPRCAFGSGTAPCLVALFRDVGADTPAGIHRIALTKPVQAWRPGTPVERRMLGRWPMPRAIKLWPATTSLVVGEGIETVLAAATRLPYRDAPLRPAWATVSAVALGRLPVIERVERLIILVDNDVNGTGQAEARRCSERWSRAAHAVVTLTPKRAGTDFNDVVLSEFKS
jgi:CHC2 zinc finger/Toprim domain